MEQEELMQFVQWLPSKVEEFQNKTPEEIVGKLNELAQTEDGMNTISGLINQFKQEQSAGMFKQGGKLAYLVNKFKDGGSAKNERKENKKVVKEGKKSSKFNRTAYRNMKSAIKDQDLGLSRREVKAAAMKNIVGDNSKPKVTKTEGSVISQPLSFGVSMKTGITPKVNVQTNATPDLSQGNFNQAFAAARSAGLTNFTWNGKLYGTQLAPTRPAPKKPKLPQSNLRSRNIPEAEEAGMSAAKGIRPANMNEELVATNPLYSDYIVASNLGNPNRFDSRYVGPRSMSVNYGNNATLGSIPVEHRINPRNLGSFFQEGGKTSQRKSDKTRKEFHGVDLFEYGPNKWVHNGAQVARSLKPGVNQTVLPNGVGLRQITRNNITTSELVSPNKQDTLYIHNGVGGRVDSNIDDSGILGFLGLRRSSPVSNRYKELQSKFGTQKFARGDAFPEIKRDTVVNNVGNLTDRGVIDKEMIITGMIPGTNNQLIDSVRRHVIAPTFENPYLGTQAIPGDTLYYRTSGIYTPSGNALQRVQDNNYQSTKEEKEKLNKK